MTALDVLKSIRKEVDQMSFSYESLFTLMHNVYRVKEILEESSLIPNKDIALDQTKKLISRDLDNILKSGKTDIENGFMNTRNSFLLILNYFTNN